MRTSLQPFVNQGCGWGKDKAKICQRLATRTSSCGIAQRLWPHSSLAQWQAQVEPLAFALIDRMPSRRPVDIVQEFARPWSLGVATIMTGANPADSERLETLAAQISLATADPSNSALGRDVTAANTELKR